MHENIEDFLVYSPINLKIQTKVDGLQPFHLREFQTKYVEFINSIHESGMPARVIVLKPRQCGFSTLVAGMNTHKMAVFRNSKVILLADKAGRTDEVFRIYDHFVNNLRLKPMISAQNSREIIFGNPDKNQIDILPGMQSSLKAETAQDPNAGRSGSRKYAHLTEFAFYPYANEIDDGVQNSIPLLPGTEIVKESTAYGMSGDGEAFFNLWEAAERGDSIYKSFFVSWFEVDDYFIKVPLGFRRTKEEIELVQECPQIVDANLMWRRLKMMEYANDGKSLFTPQERISQDFPHTPQSAFLNSGLPVFDSKKIKAHISALESNRPERPNITVKKDVLVMFKDLLTIYEVPKKGKRYIIGCDVAEGTENGDASSAFIMDSECREVGNFHGKLDPDLFGKVLVELAKIYNNALLVPEMNSMGFSTLSAIKNEGYTIVYNRDVFDVLGNETTQKLGWRTTSANKMTMLMALVSYYRDKNIIIRNVLLLKEMLRVVRESNGDVILNSKDRVVAACLALMGLKQLYTVTTVHNPNVRERVMYEKKDMYTSLAYGDKNQE